MLGLGLMIPHRAIIGLVDICTENPRIESIQRPGSDSFSGQEYGRHAGDSCIMSPHGHTAVHLLLG